MNRVLAISLSAALVGYVVLAAIYFFTQRSLLYYPSHIWVPLARSGANQAFSEISCKTEDGIGLRGWYAHATTKRFTIVFFHGNADSLSTAAPVGDAYIAAGYGFLVTEYRGYSGLPGSPTEKGLYADGREYIRSLMAQGIPVERVVLLGQSLGTGVAVKMAGEFPVAGIMLLSPFLSIPNVAQKHFPIFPAGILALDRFDNARRIGGIREPILIVNGLDDDVVPASQGRQLFTLANEPKELHQLPRRGHNDTFDDFVPLSLEWMRRTLPAS